MSMPEQVSSAVHSEQELGELRAKSASLEDKMAGLMKLVEANSNYRNEIIWLAEEINRVQKRIKDLEQKPKP